MLDAAQLWLPTLDGPAPGDRMPAPAAARPRRARRGLAPLTPPAVLPPSPQRPDVDDAQRRATRQAFLGIAVRWALSATEALTLLGEPLSDEAERHERLEALLGCHRSLLFLAPDAGRCARLLREPEPALESASLLEMMLTGGVSGLVRARQHLAARL